ncbi:MAG: Ig-like domain repeat protein, partial [Actinomycetota bacterium]
MKIYSLKKKTIPKIAVLATGLTAALLAVTISPQAAQAHVGYTQSCDGCHSAGGSVKATPSSATLAPGASYTVAFAYTGGGGASGFWISGNGVNVTGGSATSASMTAPATAGPYTYTVWVRSGVTASTTYTINVAAAPVAVTTTTALAVSPTAGVAPATANLTATVTGAGAAGTVEFFNGTTSLGTSPVASGVAAKSLTGLAVGTYSYSAKFIPTNATLFTSSTSTVKTFVVTAPVPVAVTTTTALAVSPATAVAPANATLTATVTGAGAAGTVQFFSGTTSLGTSPVVAGVATKALTGLAAGTYTYTANFIPTSAAAFTPSTSTAKTLVVTAPVPVAVTTTTALAVSPATAVAPANATLTATVTGAGAAGTVQFFNGATSLGTSPVVSGVATKSLTGLAAGSYSYTAKFIPTNAALFTTSTSTAKTLVVTVPPTTIPPTTIPPTTIPPTTVPPTTVPPTTVPPTTVPPT